MTTTPDLASYDYLLVNTSAGKDSQAMTDYVTELARAAGVEDRVVMFHADLGRVEWEGTAELAAEHAAHYGHRFERRSRKGVRFQGRDLGDLLEQVGERKAANDRNHPGEFRVAWPDSQNRWCTSDQKTAQALKLMTALVRESGVEGRPVRILNMLGLRADESTCRAAKVPFEVDTKACNTLRHVDRWLPIHGWTADQVWARIAQAGTRHHWAYDLGMPRLSCSFCVLGSRSSLVRAAQLRPELAAQYAQVEVEVGSRFTQAMSMAEIIAAAGDETVETIDDWDAGAA